MKTPFLFSVAITLTAAMCQLPQTAAAATRTVTSFDDSGPGTLRDTIAAAASGDTINFLPGIGVVTITLTSGQIVIDHKSLTIVGNGADNLVLEGGGGRVFIITNSFNLDVSISALTISRGNSGIGQGGGGILNQSGRLTVSHCKFVSNVASRGGGIWNGASLVASNCTFSLGFADKGAGIFNYTDAKIRGCAFWSNLATNGGALYNLGTCTIENSTFHANLATSAEVQSTTTRGAIGYGGAIFNAWDLPGNVTNLTVRSCTISGNSAIYTGPSCTFCGHGGGIVLSNTFMRLQNTIVERNTDHANEFPDILSFFCTDNNLICYLGGGDFVEDLGFNFIGRAGSSTNGWLPSDIVGTVAAPRVAGLGPLQDNGGPTPTMAWLPRELGIDRGYRGGLSTDQRGLPRPYDTWFDNASGGDGSDIGAYEVQGPQFTLQPLSQFFQAGQDVTFSAAATPDSAAYAPLIYYWARYGFPIAGATNATYTRNNVQLADAGAYSVVVHDSGLNYTESAPANLTVGFGLVRNVNGSGNVSASPSQAVYTNNAVVSVTATPASGWFFVNWSGDASGTNNPLSVAMTTNKVITANFAPLFGLSLATSGGGAVARSPNQPWYAPNSTVMLTATPNPDWGFSGWSGDASGRDNPLSVPMTTNKFITANFTNVSGCVLASGLVSWWPGAGNGNDLIGTNNGYLSNGVAFAAGKVGQAFSFDGTNDFVAVPGNASLSITGPITLEAWIRRSGSLVGTTQSIVNKSGAPAGGYALLIVTTGRLRFVCPTGDGVTASSGLLVGPWYHVAGVWDGATLRAYVNGAPNGIAASINSPTGGLGSLTIGAIGDAAGAPFAGLIDEVSIYNRALSDAEILGLYNAGSAGKCLTPPSITSVNQSGNNLNLSWRAQPNATYRLQFKTNLNPAAPWTDVSGDITASGPTASKTDTTTGNAAQRFYRVEMLR